MITLCLLLDIPLLLCYLIASHLISSLSKLKIKEYFSKLLKGSSPPLPDRSSPAPQSDSKRTSSLLRDFMSPDGKVRYKVHSCMVAAADRSKAKHSLDYPIICMI